MKKGKKIMSVILAGITAAVSYCSVTASAISDKDPNHDGKLTFADATYIILFLSGGIVTSDYDSLDINDNGIVSMADVFIIENYLGGNV